MVVYAWQVELGPSYGCGQSHLQRPGLRAQLSSQPSAPLVKDLDPGKSATPSRTPLCNQPSFSTSLTGTYRPCSWLLLDVWIEPPACAVRCPEQLPS